MNVKQGLVLFFLLYADAEKTTLEELEQEYKVTEWIEDGGNGILEAQVNIPNNNYDSVLNVLKAKEYVVDIEPVIGDSSLVNTSRLFYVKLHNSQDYPLLSSMASRTGAEIRGEVSFCENWYELCVDKNSIGNSIETSNQFWETGLFTSIDPGFIFHFEPASVTSCVSDFRFDEQWGMQAIKACSAWKISIGDTSIKIAVVDGGVDEGHDEFDSLHVAFSFDIETETSPAISYSNLDKYRDIIPPEDIVYHGIHVGGIIFADHNHNIVAGVAPNTSMINISTAFKVNDSISIKLASAIGIAVTNGARIINNSWGDPTLGGETYMFSTLLEDAIDSAISHQIIVVFSVGNNGVEYIPYPASYREEILTVGAIKQQLNRYEISNYYDELDIMAPGKEIFSTHNENGYCFMSGTSVAAPHVSGVAGLMLSVNPTLTSKEVCDLIEHTAQKVRQDLYLYVDTINRTNGTWSLQMGYGLVDAHRAVLKAAYHKVYGDTALTLCDTAAIPIPSAPRTMPTLTVSPFSGPAPTTCRWSQGRPRTACG